MQRVGNACSREVPPTYDHARPYDRSERPRRAFPSLNAGDYPVGRTWPACRYRPVRRRRRDCIRHAMVEFVLKSLNEISSGRNVIDARMHPLRCVSVSTLRLEHARRTATLTRNSDGGGDHAENALVRRDSYRLEEPSLRRNALNRFGEIAERSDRLDSKSRSRGTSSEFYEVEASRDRCSERPIGPCRRCPSSLPVIAIVKHAGLRIPGHLRRPLAHEAEGMGLHLPFFATACCGVTCDDKSLPCIRLGCQ